MTGKRASLEKGRGISILFGEESPPAATPEREKEERSEGEELEVKEKVERVISPPKQLKQPAKKEQEKLLKSAVFLSEEENDYLYHLGMKAKRTGGKKLPKQALIEAFVAAFMDIDWDDVGGLSPGNPEELKSRVLAALKQNFDS